MSEYIERERTVELLRSLGNRKYRKEKGTIQDAIKMISYPEYTPAADVAPVVHCKNCTHYLIVDEFEGVKRYMCKINHFSYINSDGDMHYCSYGERKNGGDNDAAD